MKIGMGGCEPNKEEVFQHAWDRGVRVFDSGRGYSGPRVNDLFLGEFLKDKKDFQIINKLPLFDKLYIENFGKSRFEMTDDELEFSIRKILESQLQDCGVEKFDTYMYHAVYDEKFMPIFDLIKWTTEYKRIGKILAKLKSEGLIDKIGFSAHINYQLLYYFVEEMEKAFGNNFLEVAEISYNILNNNGVDQQHLPWIARQNAIMVWDAPGLEGLKYLKSKGMYIIDMMPTESGRISQVSNAPDWYDWAYRFIRETKEIDMVLAGTSSVKHLDQMMDIFENKDLDSIPDMRIIQAGSRGYCHE